MTSTAPDPLSPSPARPSLQGRQSSSYLRSVLRSSIHPHLPSLSKSIRKHSYAVLQSSRSRHPQQQQQDGPAAPSPVHLLEQSLLFDEKSLLMKMYNCIVLAEPFPETDDAVILRRRRRAARRRMATLQAFARNVSLTVLSVPDPERPTAEHPPTGEGGIAALNETSDVRLSVSEAAANLLDAARIAGERSGAARLIGKLWSGGGRGGVVDAESPEEIGDDGSVSTADGTEEDYDAELLLLLELFGANLLRTLHFERAREVTDLAALEDHAACGAPPSSSRGPARSSSSGGAGDDDQDEAAPPRPCPSPPPSFPYPSKKEWEMRVLISLSLYVRSVPPHATDSVTVGRFVLKNILETLAREVLSLIHI